MLASENFTYTLSRSFSRGLYARNLKLLNFINFIRKTLYKIWNLPKSLWLLHFCFLSNGNYMNKWWLNPAKLFRSVTALVKISHGLLRFTASLVEFVDLELDWQASPPNTLKFDSGFGNAQLVVIDFHHLAYVWRIKKQPAFVNIWALDSALSLMIFLPQEQWRMRYCMTSLQHFLVNNLISWEKLNQ